MGGGDLNMKKSWHPLTFQNQERKWKAEQAHEAERKKLAELRQQLQEERAREEMDSMAVQAGLKKGSDRLEWMYRGAHNVNRDEYLLGKKIDRQVDTLAQAAEKETEAMANGPGALFVSAESDVSIDLAAKIREDPLFAIRKREEERKRALMNNPLKLSQLKKALEMSSGKKKKKKKSHHKDRSSSPAPRRLSKNDSPPVHSLRNRSMSPPPGHTHRGRSRSPPGHTHRDHPRSRYGERDRLRSPRHTHRDRSRSPPRHTHRGRSRSPPGHTHRSRSRSPPGHTHRGRSRSPPGHTHRGRSRSPPGYTHRGRSRSPPGHTHRDRSRSPPGHTHRGRSRSPPGRAQGRPAPSKSRPSSTAKPRMGREDLERRRQEMMSNAVWREEEREERLERALQQERREESRQAERRNPDFLQDMRVKSYSTDTTCSVADRIHRNRATIQRTSAALDKNFFDKSHNS